MEFTWDETKREKVLAEHKVDFAKIQDVFDDVFSLDYQDSEHSAMPKFDTLLSEKPLNTA